MERVKSLLLPSAYSLQPSPHFTVKNAMKKDKFIPEFRDIPRPRQEMPALPLEERLENFQEVELGFTEEMARAEAQRCLSCRRCIGCGLCLAECDAKAIEYDQGPETLRLQVSSIVLASGAGDTDPMVREELGYNRFANVVTTLELERILSPNGPYGGFLIRPYDGEVPRKIAFILCVGCRDAEGGASFCGSVCCQAAIGALLAAREQIPTLEAKVFYEDIRPMGPEGEEDYFRAVQTSGIQFLRGKVKEVSEDFGTKDLLVKYEVGAEVFLPF